MHMYAKTVKCVTEQPKIMAVHFIYLCVHLRVFVSVLLMNVKSMWIMYLPQQCCCFHLFYFLSLYPSYPFSLFRMLCRLLTWFQVSCAFCVCSIFLYFFADVLFCPPFSSSVSNSGSSAPVSLHPSSCSPSLSTRLPHHWLITVICVWTFTLTSLKRQFDVWMKIARL